MIKSGTANDFHTNNSHFITNFFYECEVAHNTTTYGQVILEKTYWPTTCDPIQYWHFKKRENLNFGANHSPHSKF